jgi:fructuronate reductase
MKLLDYQKNPSAWTEKGYTLPRYNRDKAAAETQKNPSWIHFGAGNIFRAFPAALSQRLLNAGEYDRGIIVCESFDTEIIEKAYRPYQNLSLLVTLKADGSIDKEVIGSVTESYLAEGKDWAEIKSVFASPTLQMASFTITEKGYSLRGASGGYIPDVQYDIDEPSAQPKSLMGKLAALLLHRYACGSLPIAMTSMDNCSHNGDKLKGAILEIAQKWQEKGHAPQAFLDYLNDSQKVSFPWSMIDKITPRPDEKVQEMLKSDGFEDADVIITQKKTYTAPFVNAEQAQYLVIEDHFPAGRPPLEKAGVLFADRETVDKVEKMKVCTCLNPLHTSLAVFGCLLGFETIYQEMSDSDLLAMVKRLGYIEGMPVVVDPGIIKPKDFIDEVVNIRLPNPFMPDTPQRIATDTSQKLPIRFGQTIQAYLKRSDLKLDDLKVIPLVFAGWCRYAMGIDDNGNAFAPSPDPLLDSVQQTLKGISLGSTVAAGETLKPILTNERIFGVDLYAVGMADKVEKLFQEMIEGAGAIRKVLHRTVQE